MKFQLRRMIRSMISIAAERPDTEWIQWTTERVSTINDLVGRISEIHNNQPIYHEVTLRRKEVLKEL